MIGRIREAYDSGGPVVRALIGRAASLLPPEIRFGASYRSTARLLRDSASWSHELMEAEVLRRLRELLKLAARSVPYYRELFASLGFDPESVTSPADIDVLPLLTRDLVREQGQRLVPEGLSPGSYRYTTTGGTSSGEPLGFFISHAASASEWAFIADAWSRVGYSPDDWRAVFRGRAIPGRISGRLWEFDHVGHAIVFSTFDMNEANLARYLEVLRRRRPPFIHAYPSSAQTLVQYLEATGARLPWVRAWLLGSEELTPGQRAYIEKVTGSRVFSWYGHSEKCVLAAECESETAYHPYDLYGLVELTRPDGSAIRQTGERGTITGTGFMGGGTVFIRYATDDSAEWTFEPCACGRPGPRLVRLEGRAHEALVGRSGVRISLVAMNLHSEVYGKLARFRFVQERPGYAELLMVTRPGFSDEDRMRLVGELRDKLEGEIELSVRVVDDLPTTSAGKFRYIDQRIDGVVPS